MEQHPIPRQVITFEFKLIGILTVKQFGYAIFFAFIAGFVFISVSIPIINILLTLLVVIIGAVFVMVKYNERSMDIWFKNFFAMIFQPVQYYYIKKNNPPAYLKDIFVPADPQVIANHVDAHQKLSTYIMATSQKDFDQQKKQQINSLMNDVGAANQSPTGSATTLSSEQANNPFISGIIKNSKSQPILGIMFYVKDGSGQVIRILKTNHNGVFASYRAFPDGTYSFEPKDLSGKYFFDTMEILIQKQSKTNHQPVSIFSKEIL